MLKIGWAVSWTMLLLKLAVYSIKWNSRTHALLSAKTRFWVSNLKVIYMLKFSQFPNKMYFPVIRYFQSHYPMLPFTLRTDRNPFLQYHTSQGPNLHLIIIKYYLLLQSYKLLFWSFLHSKLSTVPSREPNSINKHPFFTIFSKVNFPFYCESKWRQQYS